MPCSVLRANDWRVEKDGLIHTIACEPQDVEYPEVRSDALSGAAAEVEDSLGVEGYGPCGEIKPAAETAQSSSMDWYYEMVMEHAYRDAALANSSTCGSSMPKEIHH